MTQPYGQAHKLTPEYWNGYDIFDESLFTGQRTPGLYLSYENYKAARHDLQFAVGQIATGNATEVRYGISKEFNFDLPDGSLVIVDHEHINRWTYDDLEYVWSEERSRNDGPPITRPYSEFWLRHQDGTASVKPHLGTEGVNFADKFVTYSRILSFGIIATQGNGRWIQPFSFGATKLLANGMVDTPPAYKKYPALQGEVVPMPTAIGEVEVQPRFTSNKHGYTLRGMERIRSIDVVYPAAARRSGKRQRTRRLGLVALPKFGFAQS